MAKARAAIRNRHPLDPVAAGRARARYALWAPGGGFLPGSRRSQDRYVVQAQRVVERLIEMAKKPTVPALPSEAALPARPWEQLGKSEKLSAVVDLGLDFAKRVLELDVDPENVRLLAQVKDVALSVISQQIRVDEGRLRAPASDGLLEYEAAVARQEELLGLRPKKPKPKSKARRAVGDQP
jgi:hypothetical protein